MVPNDKNTIHHNEITFKSDVICQSDALDGRQITSTRRKPRQAKLMKQWYMSFPHEQSVNNLPFRQVKDQGKHWQNCVSVLTWLGSSDILYAKSKMRPNCTGFSYPGTLTFVFFSSLIWSTSMSEMADLSWHDQFTMKSPRYINPTDFVKIGA